MFIISALFYILPSQDQSARSNELTVCSQEQASRTDALTDCENWPQLLQTQFTPPLVFCTLKPNIIYTKNWNKGNTLNHHSKTRDKDNKILKENDF